MIYIISFSASAMVIVCIAYTVINAARGHNAGPEK